MIEPVYHFVTKYKQYYIFGEREEPTLHVFVEGEKEQKGIQHEGKWLIKTSKTYPQLLHR